MTIERPIKAEISKEQKLVLINRENMSVTGAKEVLSFGENMIELDTNMGMLTVKGEGLKLLSISTENETAEISGRIASMEYKKMREKQSILKTLFK